MVVVSLHQSFGMMSLPSYLTLKPNIKHLSLLKLVLQNRRWPDPESFLNANGVKQGLDKFIADVTKSGKFKIATMKDVENGKKAFMSTSIGKNEMIEKYGVVFVIVIPKYIDTYSGTAGQANYADIRVKLVNTKNGKIEERYFAKCLFKTL